MCFNNYIIEHLKGEKITLHEELKVRHQEIDEKLKKVEQQLAQMPEGDFYCTRNGKRYKWYQSFGNKESVNYIPKSNQDFAQKLAYKKYLTLQFEELIQEKKAIEAYFKKYPKNNSKLEQFLNHPEYKKLLLPMLDEKTKELEVWMNESYEKNTSHPEHLIHKTITGEMVRSKSESLIYTYLTLNHIPFRYENPLILGQACYYPDFTIRHPKTGEFYYWENNGMMDDIAYAQRAYAKMQVYTMHGIIPGKTLITTFETVQEPLNAEEVKNIVKQYFLK